MPSGLMVTLYWLLFVLVAAPWYSIRINFFLFLYVPSPGGFPQARLIGGALVPYSFTMAYRAFGFCLFLVQAFFLYGLELCPACLSFHCHSMAFLYPPRVAFFSPDRLEFPASFLPGRPPNRFFFPSPISPVCRFCVCVASRLAWDSASNL